jgi:hypothetical protein
VDIRRTIVTILHRILAHRTSQVRTVIEPAKRGFSRLLPTQFIWLFSDGGAVF